MKYVGGLNQFFNFPEVQNECLGNGGRCSLTEAATALNVDFDHVDAAAKRLVAEDDSYKLFNGELFSQ